MKVKFENCEVDVWKLRKGVVLSLSQSKQFVHLHSFYSINEKGGKKVRVCVEHFNTNKFDMDSELITWLEPH